MIERIQSSEGRCSSGGAATRPQVPGALLLWVGDLPRPGSQASAEFVRPFVHRLEDHAPAFTADQNLALRVEPALLWESDGLTAAVLEQLRSSTFHGVGLGRLCPPTM